MRWLRRRCLGTAGCTAEGGDASGGAGEDGGGSGCGVFAAQVT